MAFTALLVAWQQELMEQVVVKQRLLDGTSVDGRCGSRLVSRLGWIPGMAAIASL